MFRKIASMLCLIVALVTINSFSMEISSLLNIEGNQDVIEDLFVHNAGQIFQENKKACVQQEQPDLNAKELDRVKLLRVSVCAGDEIGKNFMWVCPLCTHHPYVYPVTLIKHVQNKHNKIIKN